MGTTLIHYHDNRVDIVWSDDEPHGELRADEDGSLTAVASVKIRRRFDAPTKVCPDCGATCVLVRLFGTEEEVLAEAGGPLRLLAPEQLRGEVFAEEERADRFLVHSCRACALSDEEADRLRYLAGTGPIDANEAAEVSRLLDRLRVPRPDKGLAR